MNIYTSTLLARRLTNGLLEYEAVPRAACRLQILGLLLIPVSIEIDACSCDIHFIMRGQHVQHCTRLNNRTSPLYLDEWF